MELDDQNLNIFIDTVCNYMETWHSFDDTGNDFSLDELCEEPYSEFKKLLKVFYRALDRLHNNWFNSFFTPDTIEWDYVHSLLSTHCFVVVKRYTRGGIFICLLYVCSFTYSLLDFCDKKGLIGRLNVMQALLKEIFIKDIKHWFTCRGGWDGLKMFCQRENLPKVLQLISDCYCDVTLFKTYVQHKQYVYSFGCQSRETTALFLNNLKTFEDSVLEAFKYDLFVNPDYEQLVRRDFSLLSTNLKNTLSENYLPIDMVQLKITPM